MGIVASSEKAQTAPDLTSLTTAFAERGITLTATASAPDSQTHFNVVAQKGDKTIAMTITHADLFDDGNFKSGEAVMAHVAGEHLLDTITEDIEGKPEDRTAAFVRKIETTLLAHAMLGA